MELGGKRTAGSVKTSVSLRIARMQTILTEAAHGVKEPTVGKRRDKSFHRKLIQDKAQLRAPADCLNFPSQFLLDALSTRSDRTYELLFIILLGSLT